MKLKLTKLIPAILISALGLGFLAAQPTFAAENDICEQLSSDSLAYEANGCDNKTSDITEPIYNIINVVMGIIGLICVVVIIIGGVQYMTSTGNPGKVSKAKDTLLYAIIGLVVISLAAVIVNFVIDTTTKNPPEPKQDASSYTKKADCTKAGYTWDSKAKKCTK